MKHSLVYLALTALVSLASSDLQAAGAGAAGARPAKKVAKKMSKKKSKKSTKKSKQASTQSQQPKALEAEEKELLAVLQKIGVLSKERAAKMGENPNVRQRVAALRKLMASPRIQELYRQNLQFEEREAALAEKKERENRGPSEREKYAQEVAQKMEGQPSVEEHEYVRKAQEKELQQKEKDLASRLARLGEAPAEAKQEAGLLAQHQEVAERLAHLRSTFKRLEEEQGGVASEFQEQLRKILPFSDKQRAELVQHYPHSLQRLQQRVADIIDAHEFENPEAAQQARETFKKITDAFEQEIRKAQLELFDAIQTKNIKRIHEMAPVYGNIPDHDGNTPLMVAVMQSNDELPVVQAIVNSGVNLDAQNKQGMTALMFAALHDFRLIVGYLIHKGANVALTNSQGRTAFGVAGKKSYSILGESEARQAGAQARREQATPAAPMKVRAQQPSVGKKSKKQAKGKKKSKKSAKKVAKKKVMPGDRSQLNNQFLRAAYDGDGPMLRAALVDGVDVNTRDSLTGSTALMWAAHQGDAAGVETLLQYKADPNLADDKGLTALMLAAKNDHPVIIQKLLAAHAQINAQDLDGRTALMAATAKDARNAVRELLVAGADIMLKDKNGKTAIDLGATEDVKRLIGPKEREVTDQERRMAKEMAILEKQKEQALTPFGKEEREKLYPRAPILAGPMDRPTRRLPSGVRKQIRGPIKRIDAGVTIEAPSVASIAESEEEPEREETPQARRRRQDREKMQQDEGAAQI